MRRTSKLLTAVAASVVSGTVLTLGAAGTLTGDTWPAALLPIPLLTAIVGLFLLWRERVPESARRIIPIRWAIGGLVALQTVLSIIYASAEAALPVANSHGRLGRAVALVAVVLWPYSGPASLLLLPHGHVIYVPCLIVLLALLLSVTVPKREPARIVLMCAAFIWWLLSGVMACGVAFT
jgi:hypothetical protein